MNPEKFGVKSVIPFKPTFADNDVVHEDPTGADHETFSFGLKKSLLNYMNGIGLDEPLYKWFDRKVPATRVAPDYIDKALAETEYAAARPTAKVVWTGNAPVVEFFTKTKKGQTWEMASLTFYSKKGTLEIKVGQPEGKWLAQMLERLSVANPQLLTMQQVQESYENEGLEDFPLFWDNKPVNTLYKMGLLVL
jgi:hypothetical protein